MKEASRRSFLSSLALAPLYAIVQRTEIPDDRFTEVEERVAEVTDCLNSVMSDFFDVKDDCRNFEDEIANLYVCPHLLEKIESGNLDFNRESDVDDLKAHIESGAYTADLLHYYYQSFESNIDALELSLDEFYQLLADIEEANCGA